MNRRYRKTIIAGNWKMNKTPTEAKALIEEMKPALSRCKWCEMVLCVPFTDIQNAVKAARGSKIAIGAQNMHFEKSGAFTGEVSADMLKEMGVKFVIIGHSERRQYFGETDISCNKKVKVALAAGLRPILCCGETLEEREQDVTMEVVRKQIKIALRDVAAEDIKKVVIAYEPIWAIGTGKTATAEQAGEVCSAIRDCLRELYGARAARAITVQYGGSMNAKNAAELLAQPDVDGGLIGGASLKAADFAAIVDAANQ
ncbi:MAG: triose-phosphate isomerase [Clostridiaceae bacterium]|nr:triose-phosphate isomerase [Clostridiaceae bacterium]MCI9483299.1 triose-phosphate isomerase [Clostridiaceae bacterium]NBH79238.1 triose-phosphate isomerase [Clostridiaceae bacterium]NBI83580.1 triose-phosphate isomerase [Clostridiaceae bacterium]RKJ78069.1 triose-phosphate isomerase [Butyricicoccus sp. 1XD8-22]